MAQKAKPQRPPAATRKTPANPASKPRPASVVAPVEASAPATPSSSSSVWIVIAGLAVLAAVSLGFRATRSSPAAAARPATAPSAAPTSARNISPHPGSIETREVWWRPGDDHIRPEDCEELNGAWGAPDRATLESAMRTAGLSDATIESVLEVAVCDAEGCIVVPPDSVLEGLTQPQRVGVYHAMRGYPQAMLLNAPFSRPVGRTAFADAPGLSPTAREIFRAGSFVDGEKRMFSDLTWLCHRVTDRAERAAFFRVLRARSALDAVVRVRTESELERAVRWWGTGGREAAARARLNEAYVNGTEVPLRDLLPPFARARYGTFPPRDTRYDCFWTAVNFSSPTEAGGPLIDDTQFDATMASWTQVPLNELRFGDVLAFRTEAGATLHAAVYIAEDLVFTKDGWTMHRSWELVRLSTERRIYYEAPEIVAFRAPSGATAP